MTPHRNRVNNKADPAFTAAVAQTVADLLPTLTARITDEISQNENNRNTGNPRNDRRINSHGSGDAQPTDIHVWLERFQKQKPQTFSSASMPVEAENWIAHIERSLRFWDAMISLRPGQRMKETTRVTETAIIYDHQISQCNGLVKEYMIVETVTDMGIMIDMEIMIGMEIVTDMAKIDRGHSGIKISRAICACFICGQGGHFAKYCDKNRGLKNTRNGNNRQHTTWGRVSALTTDQAANAPGHERITRTCRLFNIPLRQRTSKRKKPKDKAEYSSKPDHAECSSKLETKKNGRTSEAIKERWTMGRDENNHMHPLAWAGYGGDLELGYGAGLTVLSDGHKVEVKRGDVAYGVNLHTKKRGCNFWELSGIPSVYAMAAYYHMSMDLELGVNEFFSKQSWYNAYQYSIKPVPGSKLWKPCDNPSPLPLIERKRPDKPRKQRSKHPTEDDNHVSRVGREYQYKMDMEALAKDSKLSVHQVSMDLLVNEAPKKYTTKGSQAQDLDPAPTLPIQESQIQTRSKRKKQVAAIEFESIWLVCPTKRTRDQISQELDDLLEIFAMIDCRLENIDHDQIVVSPPASPEQLLRKIFRPI
nr:zinc finger, PMZ-type [Tanacetum cinerariifolium]